MEPNASSSPAAVLEHGAPSVREPALLFSPAPAPGLVVPASGSGSERSSSGYQPVQIPPSPAVAAVGSGALSVHAHTTSSSSPQSVPSSSCFPLAGTLPSAGYDLFAKPPGESSSPRAAAAPAVLPERPSPGMLGFAAGEYSAAWPSALFSPSSSAGGRARHSGDDNVVGFVAAQPASGSELEPLPQSLRVPEHVEEEDEEEIDVSAFLVSDPEDRLPNLSWTASPWPPIMSLPPAPAGSTCNVVSTSSGSMACHSVARSIANMVIPSSQGGAGASSSNFNACAQPSSSSVLAPLGRGPLLPVKQEVLEYVHATERHHPDFVSLDDDEEEDGLYQHATFGSWGGHSSSPSFGPASWGGGGSSRPSFAPGSRGSRRSFAPGSWGSRSSSPSFDGSMLCFNQSTSIHNNGSSSMHMLSIREMSSISGLPPLPRAGASTRNGASIVFTDREKAIIAKDKKLQELLRIDAKKVKRILYNRAYSAVAKVRKVMHTKNLEHMIVTLEERRKSLHEELQSLEEGSATLLAQKMEMEMLIGELEQQTMLKDVLREGLRAEIQTLKHLKRN